ncbi:MAG: SAM-dependent methyltransferase [Paludibacteraceae bacterium]|nr:SAM-dependent methyltransferase [Paludibacteraceae bacterium]
MQPGKLFLIPTTLGDSPLQNVLPAQVWTVVSQLRYFVVEDVRTARRYLKRLDKAIDIDSLHFEELNRHTSQEQIEGMLTPLAAGYDLGIISEAGCPAIADPGADVVAIAQRRGYQVVPMVGPSSILMSMMASGFNGQSFAFLGYLPIDPSDKQKQLKVMENRIWNESQTQIFIETPYRNNKLVADLLRQLRPATKLCIASDISLDTEWIVTKTVADWRKTEIPDLGKRPTIFLLYR